MLLWTKKRQELWDLVADTIVVHDPMDQLNPKAIAAAEAPVLPAPPAVPA
jgi:uncharacterized RDD family membrane protein YckC